MWVLGDVHRIESQAVSHDYRPFCSPNTAWKRTRLHCMAMDKPTPNESERAGVWKHARNKELESKNPPAMEPIPQECPGSSLQIERRADSTKEAGPWAFRRFLARSYVSTGPAEDSQNEWVLEGSGCKQARGCSKTDLTNGTLGANDHTTPDKIYPSLILLFQALVLQGQLILILGGETRFPLGLSPLMNAFDVKQGEQRTHLNPCQHLSSQGWNPKTVAAS